MEAGFEVSYAQARPSVAVLLLTADQDAELSSTMSVCLDAAMLPVVITD